MLRRIDLYSGEKRIGRVSGNLPENNSDASKKAVEVCRKALGLPTSEAITTLDAGEIKFGGNFAEGEIKFGPTGVGLSLMQKHMGTRHPKASNKTGFVEGVW